MRNNKTTYTLRDKIAIGFAGGGLLLLFLLFIFGPLVINYLGGKQMNALFEGKGMEISDAEAVIKRPYIVYGRDNKGDWQKDYEIYNTELMFRQHLILHKSNRCAIMIPNDDREGSYAVVQICDRVQRQGQG